MHFPGSLGREGHRERFGLQYHIRVALGVKGRRNLIAARAEPGQIHADSHALLLRLGDRQSAVQSQQKAFQEKEDVTLVSECLSIYYMSGDEEAFHNLAEKYRIPESVLAAITEKCDQAGMDYESSERARELEELLAQPGRKGTTRYIEETKKRDII